TTSGLPLAGQIRIGAGRDPLVLPARRVWNEWRARGAQAGLAFEALDAEKHRALVELIFSDDRSWLRSTYPRDDPFRSFGYLLTTLWRVTRPRRPWRRSAPRVAGRWPCRVNGRPAVCVSLSAGGGLVELKGPLAIGAHVRVELDAGAQDATLRTIDGRAVRVLSAGVALRWEPDQEAGLSWVEELVAHQQVAEAQTGTRRWSWRSTEALRT